MVDVLASHAFSLAVQSTVLEYTSIGCIGR
jgi:hypothetical protein